MLTIQQQKELYNNLLANDRIYILSIEYATEVMLSDYNSSIFYGSDDIYNKLTSYASIVLKIESNNRRSEINNISRITTTLLNKLSGTTTTDVSDEDIISVLPLVFELLAGVKKEDTIVEVVIDNSWGDGKKMIKDRRITYNGNTYVVVQPHSAQNDWTPDVSNSLFTKITIDQVSGYPMWVQPLGAHDSYSFDDIVTHNGQNWKSTHPGTRTNSWEPGVYGWVVV